MPTVEVLSVTLVEGSEIGDPNNETAKVVKGAGDLLHKQDGMQELQFGMMVEHPSWITFMIKWDGIEKHHDFQATEIYQPFLEQFGAICAGPPQVTHVDFKPEAGYHSALSAPVTEVATFYFDPAPGANAHEGVEKCISALEKESGQKIHGWAYGLTHETIEREGVKGKGAVLVIGWDAVENHMAARETQAFKDNIHLLRGDAKKIEMHHVPFMKSVPN